MLCAKNYNLEYTTSKTNIMLWRSVDYKSGLIQTEKFCNFVTSVICKKPFVQIRLGCREAVILLHISEFKH